MHEPHSVHPVRSGPAPPKYGSFARSPGLPKYTPTGVVWKESSTPMSFATSRITTSDGVMVGFVTTPSMRLAWS